MAVEVLMMGGVAGLGEEGDVVKVAEGYARNYLFPQKLAAPVTQGMRRRLVRLQEKRREENAAREQEARAMAETLAADSCTIAVKVGENERLYGSVTSADIAEALARGGHAVDKHWIDIKEPIRELGVYDVQINIPPSVTVTIKVWVVEE